MLRRNLKKKNEEKEMVQFHFSCTKTQTISRRKLMKQLFFKKFQSFEESSLDSSIEMFSGLLARQTRVFTGYIFADLAFFILDPTLCGILICG